ncbi:MAG: DUF4332 domain-containing protein [Cyanobacteriota bacterium]|jgi:hypothetical protein
MAQRPPQAAQDPFGALPPHFRAERQQLQTVGIHDWAALAGLEDSQLRALAADGRSSEARLLLLRGQARLVVDLALPPEQAALLLHAGIASREGLAASNPQALLLQVGRLQRRLLGPAAPPLTLATVHGWIHRARQASGRSAN